MGDEARRPESRPAAVRVARGRVIGRPRVRREAFPGGIVGYRFARAPRALAGWCWRVGATLIDAGAPGVARDLLEAVRADGPVERVIVTHHHEDHAGNAALLRAELGARIVAPSWSLPLLRAGYRQKPYQALNWGLFPPFDPDEAIDLPALGEAVVPTPDGPLVALHAPGHAHDLTALWDPERRVLYAADLYLASRLKVMRGDEAWSALRASLERVLERSGRDGGIAFLACGHRPVAEGGRERLERKLAWMRALETGVAEADAAGRPAGPLAGPGDPSFRAMSLGDVSRANLLRSLRGDVRPRPDVAARVGRRIARCDFVPGERAAWMKGLQGSVMNP